MRLFDVSHVTFFIALFFSGSVFSTEPIVIAHRGASGYLPEHTLAAYEKAIDLGADFVEPDLVITKDGVLIARHDHYLSTTTNVADHEAFTDRRRVVDGREDWFTEDFTLEEIKTLRARQAFEGRSTEHDGRFEIPTFQEVIDLVKAKREETRRNIGLYPETKVPGHFESLGFDFAELLLARLTKNDMTSSVYIQSFEPGILRKLNEKTDLPLVQLVNPAGREQPNEPNIPLEEIATYADGIGAFKVLLIDPRGGPSDVIRDAKALGLFIHAWTFRDDAYPRDYFPSARAELTHFLYLGIDGFFTDFPDTGVSVRDRMLANRPSPDRWTHFGGSQHGEQFSSLDIIDRNNVDKLEQAWVYRTGETGEGAGGPYAFQANPILVQGSLYVSTGTGIVIALDPETGEEKWRHDPKLDRSRRSAEVANRGVSSWIDPARTEEDECGHRIFVGLLDSRLIALDGKTGQPCSDFGQAGTIHLNKGVRLADDNEDVFEYSLTSPPVVVRGLVISGSAIGDNRAVELELGIVRGFDARTGEPRWSWDPIPRNPDDPMHHTWKPDEVARTGAANAWAPLAADVERGLVFVPTGSPSPDFYGGEREGDNRYADSVVALDAGTGEVVWHQQLIHHNVWDYDVPAQPTLVDLEHEGERIPAVMQGTKTGMIFTFHRETGEPIFEVEERPVPQGGVEGEHLSPTQPFPVKPPPLVRTGKITGDDAWGMLLFDKWACANEFEKYRSDGIFTPPSLEGTLQMPSYAGGINWGGVAFDPESQIAVANTNDAAFVVQLIPRDELMPMYESGKFPDSEFARQTGTPYGMRRQPVFSPLGAPCSEPPWGNLAAVDMRKGEIIWQRPLGTIEDLVPGGLISWEPGVPGMGGPIVTAGGLIFIGAAMDNYIRAFDLTSGEERWKARLPAGGQATPMTYYLPSTGKQYVVIAAGGHPRMGTKSGDYVVAFRLP